MKIQMMLAVRPPLAARVRARWEELGGLASVILPGSEKVQLTFVVPDRESAEGRLLDQVAGEFQDSGRSAPRLRLLANYDDDDVASGDLLLLSVGTVEHALDLASVDAGRTCEACNMPLPTRLTGKPRLEGKELKKVDLFNSEGIVFVRSAIAEKLRRFRGAVLTKVASPEGEGAFSALEAASDLGYPVGTSWGPPCPRCGLRQGSHEVEFVMGMFVFPRAAWDGSDFVGTALPSNFLIVTQGPWKVLSDPQWRVAEGPMTARPTHLVDGAEPVR